MNVNRRLHMGFLVLSTTVLVAAGCNGGPVNDNEPQQSSCDDGNRCTTDQVVSGICVYTDVFCGSGTQCSTVSGNCVPSGCQSAEQCDDGDPCTEDFCEDGACAYELLPCPCGDECAKCVPARSCDSAAECDDGNECSQDACEFGICTYRATDCPETTISASWQAANEEVHVDINWRLPSGEALLINRCSWSDSCAESVSLEREQIADGLHYLRFDLFGSGRAADIEYTVSFLGIEIHIARLIIGNLTRNIGIDVQDGVPRVVYNDWDAESATTTGYHPVELVAGWRNAQEDVHVDIDMWLPSGERVVVEREMAWALEGFERIKVPRGTSLDSGIYQVNYNLLGSGRFTDTSVAFEFPCFRFEDHVRETGNQLKVLGVDIVDGQSCVFFNGWVPVGDALAGQLCARPLEATGGWRNAGGDVHIDVDVSLPSGERLPVWRQSWNPQGFERTFVPRGTPLPNGTYRFHFKLFGSGRFADVSYRAKLYNWSFESESRILGNAEFTIDVLVAGGVATETANTWR